MNIFVLDYNIQKCAEYTCDKHVVKMILESAQMLSTTCRLSGVDCGYKVTHINHPANKWCRLSLSNWVWLRSLVTFLNEEWKNRYNHQDNHKSFNVVKDLLLPKIPDIGLTDFAQAMPDKYKNLDAVTAYRNYYKGEKQGFATWRNGQPWWWN